jgi:DNA-binding CsgD family transcriptional regulator
MGSVILDPEHKVVFVNEIARRIAESRDGFEFADNRIRIHDTDARHRFQAMLDGDEALLPRSLNLDRAGGKHSLQLQLVNIAAPAQPPRERAMRAVFITDPDSVDHLQVGALRAIFGFTDSEAQVAEALVHGSSVTEIARQRRVSADAVRFHLKNMYQKTGTHRQAELVQLILKNPFGRHSNAYAARSP